MFISKALKLAFSQVSQYFQNQSIDISRFIEEHKTKLSLKQHHLEGEEQSFRYMDQSKLDKMLEKQKKELREKKRKRRFLESEEVKTTMVPSSLVITDDMMRTTSDTNMRDSTEEDE